MEILDVFQYDYIYRALASSIMVGLICGVLGCFIVLRNMALIGDALSHAILPGVVVGFLIAGHSVFAFFTGAVVAGFISAILITWIQNNVKTKNDAAIGIVFSAMFAIGVIGISWLSRQEGVHIDLKDFLFGNVLGISNEDLVLNGVILLFVVLAVRLFYRSLLMSTFQSKVAQSIGISVNVLHYFLMLLLSLAVVSALQSVGVILVIAMLIVPASTANLLTYRLKYMLFIAAGIGVVSAVFGLLLAVIFETTPGPSMTLFATFLYVLAVLFAPKKGLLRLYWMKKKRQQFTFEEDVLKAMVRIGEKGLIRIEDIVQRLDTDARKVEKALVRLARKGFIQWKSKEIGLLKKGTDHAYEMIRKHRLWETYLVQKMGLKVDQIHDEAERLEHILSTDFIDTLDQTLGFPTLDPHGSPIPQRNNKLGLMLSDLKIGQAAIVTTHQANDEIALKLWQMRLTPNSKFAIKEILDQQLVLEVDGDTIEMTKEIAKEVKVALI